MKPNVELKAEQKATVGKIYRRLYRGKWLKSDVPLKGYKLWYFAEKDGKKINSSLYHSSYDSAKKRAEAYNKKLVATLKGREKNIDAVYWETFDGTDFQKPYIWFHSSPSWIYAHMGMVTDVFDLETLLSEGVNHKYPNDMHTNKDFFDLLFSIPGFNDYELKEVDGEYKIFKINNGGD